jgi:hypothetical protein
MPNVFEALPGIEVDVGSVTKGLDDLWRDAQASGEPAPATDDAKATQVNFVLHLGLNTTPDDAAGQFQTVSRFCHRYPGRIVVLCPLHEDAPDSVMRAKIYGECYFGKSKSDKRCVEFVMLSYPQSARRFLESQVSICLSTDLPLYYWAHRFSATSRLADYRYLLGRAKRVLIDSALSPQDTLTYPWPRPEALRDLVYARLLPARQTIGQFLAGYAPAALVNGLKSVTVMHAPELAAEGRVLGAWTRERLVACGVGKELPTNVVAIGAANGQPDKPDTGRAGDLALTFDYGADANGRRFRWTGNVVTGHALFDANLGCGETKLSAAVSLLAPENALSEAMFF